MRYLMIDDLSREERVVVENFLRRNATPGPIDNLFWLRVPDELLEAIQREHQGCGPFFFGIELQDESVAFELLVRSQTTLHCQCIAYASAAQRAFMLAFVDRLTTEERLRA